MKMEQEKEAILEKLKLYSGHKYLSLTTRGNSAILLAMLFLKKTKGNPKLMIPDQGGWFTYKSYAEFLEIDLIELKTDRAYIDTEKLEKELKKADAIMFSSTSGYFAQNDLEKIYELCQKNDCYAIVDISGSISNPEYDNKVISDISISSFGNAKVINCGVGGFIGFKNRENYDIIKILLDNFKLDTEHYTKLLENLKQSPHRLEKLKKKSDEVKRDLKDCDIIHPDKESINVLISYSNEKEKGKIMNYCEKSDLEYTECPRYIRVNEKAISIEIKRLNFD